MPMLTAIALTLVAQSTPPAFPTIIVDRDNIAITRSCRITIGATPIIDADGNGVIHIKGDDLIVEFDAASPSLHGAKPAQLPDSFAGKGIVITGRNVTLSKAKVSGFKVGIHALNSDGLTIADCDVSGNYAQHLMSTPRAEDASDWLFPHNNDNNEWITQHGAGLCVEDSDNVTLHNIRARRTQNGIILDAVNDSKVYDCDCSFLSGWGLAMWRSSRNIISRNAFDFCIRGYSHGVYNRGQDSAGILAFEQCSDNVFVENSATHGGDGYFGFAGKEALGEVNPKQSPSAYKHRGSNGNTFVRNDFSFAAAHGLELTFSFRNRISGNVFRGNAICGIWGGYSQATIIDGNLFAANGEGAYGLERGGINIEHGRYNTITGNRFEEDKCGVHLWWDDDKHLLSTIWARANEPLSSNNFIVGNEFARTPIAIQLRETTLTDVSANIFEDVAKPLDADASSPADLNAEPTIDVTQIKPMTVEALGESRPVGARGELAGRDNIIMTEWGPWDHASPLLQFVQRNDRADEYRLLGFPADAAIAERVTLRGDAELDINSSNIRVSPKAADVLAPYELSVRLDETPPLIARGTLTGGTWTVKTFKSPADPRTDVEAWRQGADAPDAHTLTTDAIDFAFGGGGMTEARKLPAILPRDHFGVIATRSLIIPAGKYRLDTTSDDGIRVWIDDQLVIDDWTWHAPKRQHHDFEIDKTRTVKLRIEYFELDGHAVLQVDLTQR